jgi:hypothetical protein
MKSESGQPTNGQKFQEFTKLPMCNGQPLVKLGMKVERKLSDFSAEKWKQNENMKMEMEFCGMETETKILWRKWKQKRNSIFRWNRCRNGNLNVSN